MTLAELRAKKRASELEKRDLLKKISNSNNVEEIKKLGKQLDSVNDNIYNIEDDIFYLENSLSNGNNSSYIEGRGETTKPVGEFNPIATYRNINSVKCNELKESEPIINGDAFGDICLRKDQKFPFKPDINYNQAERSLDLGKYMRGVITGDWTDAEPERRSMLTSSLGTIIPQELSSRIIDGARAKSLFLDSSVPIAPMHSNTLTFARVKNDPTIYFKAEGEKAVESDFELEPVTLTAKTAYAYTYASLETIINSENLKDIMFEVLSKALADCIDRGFLYGQYEQTVIDDSSLKSSKRSLKNGLNFATYAPKGIMNDQDVHRITSENSGYDDFIKAIGKVKSNNAVPTCYAINSRVEEKLSLLKTPDGQYLETPNAIRALTPIVTNQLKFDEENGSDAIVFDPNSMIVGIQNKLVVEYFRNTDKCIENGLVGFRIYAMVDCAILKPKNICIIEGIK